MRCRSRSRARRFRLEILRAAFPPGDAGRERQRRAVGIAEIQGAGPARRRPAHAGALRARLRRAGGARSAAGASGCASAARVEDLDAGRPLRAAGCAPRRARRRGRRGCRLPPRDVRAVPAAAALAARAEPRRRRPGRVVSARHRDPRRPQGRPARPDRPRPPDPRRELQPRPPRDLRRPGPRRARGRRRLRHGLARARVVPRRRRSPSPRTGWCSAGYALSLLAGAACCSACCSGGAPRADAKSSWRGRCDDDAARRAASGALSAPPRRARSPCPSRSRFGFVFAARGHAAVRARRLPRPVARDRRAAARARRRRAARHRRARAHAADPPENRGGYNPEYASERIAVHWVAVAGIALFALARALSRARGRPGRARSAPPTGAAPPAPAP